MTIIALVIYVIILVVFAVPASAIVYHLAKFGIKKDFCKLMMTIFIIVSLVLLTISLFLVLTIDFETVFESIPIEFQLLETNL